MRMYKSSAYSLQRRLKVTIKAMQDIVDSCDREIKCTHPSDTIVIKWHEQERAFATNMIVKLMKQMDQTATDIRNGID